MTSATKAVALIGTGAIGLAAGERLLERGQPLVVWNRTRATALPLEALGARIAGSLEEACASSDTLVFCLPGARVLGEMLGALGGSLRGKTVIQLGLVSRGSAWRLKRKVLAPGGAYLNVAPCGSRSETAKGTLVLLTGGKRRTFARCEELLRHLGTPIHLGTVRASATAGLSMMALSFSYVISFCQAVGTMLEGGEAPEALLDAIERSLAFTNAASFYEAWLASPATETDGDAGERAFFSLAWPRDVPEPTAPADAPPLPRALHTLISAAFRAYRLVLQMLDAARVPRSIVSDVFTRSPVFNDVQRGFLLAYMGRLALRNYGSPSSTVRVMHEELRQLRRSLVRLGIELSLPVEMATITRECLAEGLADADSAAVFLVLHRPPQSDEKRRALADNAAYVNPGRVGFFLGAGMDFVMGKREGAYLHDLDGKVTLFDAHCNGGVFNLGHRHPEIGAALREATLTLDIGNHHLLSAQRGALAHRLADLLPGDISRVVFGVAGGEAVDVAIKIARASTKRRKILYARGGYHGHTGLAVFAGDPRFFEDFAERPAGYEEIALGIPSLLEKLDEDTAAVIYETVPASVGLLMPPPDFYRRVRKACDAVGALLIIDEVQCGWGRSGKLWGIEYYDVVPDVMVLGKGMSAGHYPMSAACFRPHLGEYLTRDSFRHQSTMGGSEIGCAVVQKQLDILTEPGFLTRVLEVSAQFARELAALKTRNDDIVVEIRQLGMLMGIVYADAEYGPVMTRCAYDEGLLLVFAGLDPRVSQLLPPLTITDEEVALVIRKLEAALGRARALFQLRRFAGG